MKKIAIAMVLAAVTVLAWSEGQAQKPKASDVPPKIVFVDMQRTEAADDGEVLAYAEKKLNVDIELVRVANDQRLNKINLMMVSGEQLDYFTTGGYTEWPNYVLKGNMLAPLNELLDKYGKNIKDYVARTSDAAESWRVVTYQDGKIYGIPQPGFAAKISILVRQDWLDKLGMKAPTTIDEFTAMMRAMKNADFDGNGKVDTYPLVVDSGAFDRLKAIFLKSFVPGGFSWFMDTDGKLKPEFMHPGFKKYLTVLSDWYKEGLIHPEAFILKPEQAQQAYSRGASGVLVCWYTNARWADNAKSLNPEARTSVINPPTGPAGKGGTLAQSIVVETRVINRNSKNPDKVVQIIDWSCDPESNYMLVNGIEGKHFVWTDKAAWEKTVPQGLDPAKVGYLGSLNKLGLPDGVFFANLLDPLGWIKKPLQTGKYPMYKPVDYMFTYDWTGTKTKDVLNDLTTFQNEAEIKTITGVSPVAAWDSLIAEWLRIGGQAYIDERTVQYLKMKK